jgi:serine/threonine protein phosphatase 1
MIKITHGDWQPTPKPVHTDHLISAIGDVHGRADLLEPLMEALADDLGKPGIDHATNIFLGDLIDRGPDPLNVLGLAAGGLAAFARDPGTVADVVLMGNHDRWLRDCLLGDPELSEIELWLQNGGAATLKGFGVTGLPVSEAIPALVRKAAPGIVRELMEQMKTHYRIGDWFFVHAGLDPRHPLEDQDEEALLWIRDAFLDPEDGWPFGVVVVHGHTPEEPFEEPTVVNHRINLDTGAFFTNILTALQMRDDKMRFVQAIG